LELRSRRRLALHAVQEVNGLAGMRCGRENRPLVPLRTLSAVRRFGRRDHRESPETRRAALGLLIEQQCPIFNRVKIFERSFVIGPSFVESLAGVGAVVLISNRIGDTIVVKKKSLSLCKDSARCPDPESGGQ
jgi:hypothetical protein